MVTYTIILIFAYIILMHEACGTFPNENCWGILVGKGAEPIKISHSHWGKHPIYTPVDRVHQQINSWPAARPPAALW